MTYIEFKRKFQNAPVIASKDAVKLEKDRQIMRNQLNRWRKKGLVVRMKRGLYLLNRDDRRAEPDRGFIANQLYGPSYISLEYALGIYGLIPERVSDVTSVTTKKTARFKNELGVFVYQHVKPEAFRGFRAVKGESGMTVLMAEPEKAVVDFLYLNLERFTPGAREIFGESYRFQKTEGLKQGRIIDFAGLFGNRKLTAVAKDFCEFIGGERKR